MAPSPTTGPGRRRLAVRASISVTCLSSSLVTKISLLPAAMPLGRPPTSTVAATVGVIGRVEAVRVFEDSPAPAGGALPPVPSATAAPAARAAAGPGGAAPDGPRPRGRP